MAEGFFLTEADVLAIRDMKDHLERLVPRPGPPSAEDTLTAPEVYVARTPTAAESPPNGGIPGLKEESGVGFKDEPGFADCKIYRILRSTDNKLQLRPYPGLEKRVFNLSLEAIPPETWVLVVRHKDGSWMAVTGGGGGENTCVARITTNLGGGRYDAVRGDGTFNPQTLQYERGKRIRFIDAAVIGIPNPPP